MSKFEALVMDFVRLAQKSDAKAKASVMDLLGSIPDEFYHSSDLMRRVSAVNTDISERYVNMHLPGS